MLNGWCALVFATAAITFLLALNVVRNPVGILSGLGSPYIFSHDFKS
jgi:hypothetical protein